MAVMDILFGSGFNRKTPISGLPDQPRNFLSTLFEWLDNPGAAVRNTVTGRPLEALKSVGDFLTAEQFNWQKEREKPDFGLVGNIALDPLTYVGGLGLFGKGGKAAFKGLRLLEGKVPEKAVSLATKALTRPGRKALTRSAKTLAKETNGNWQDILRGYHTEVAEYALKAPTNEAFYQAVESSPTLAKAFGAIKPANALNKGGLRVGLPFLEGGIGEKGLMQERQVFDWRKWGGKAIASKPVQKIVQSAPVQAVAEPVADLISKTAKPALNLTRKIYRTAGMYAREKVDVARQIAGQAFIPRQAIRDTVKLLGKTVDPTISRHLVEAIHTSYGAADPQAAEAFLSTLYKPGDKVFEHLGAVRSKMGELLERDIASGRIQAENAAKMSPATYIPIYLTSEARKAIEGAPGYSKMVSEASEAANLSGASRMDEFIDIWKKAITDPNTKPRTRLKLQKLLDENKLVETNIQKLVARRTVETMRHEKNVEFFLTEILNAQGLEYTAKNVDTLKAAMAAGKEVPGNPFRVVPEMRTGADGVTELVPPKIITPELLQLKSGRELADMAIDAANKLDSSGIADFITKGMGRMEPRGALSQKWRGVAEPFKKAVTGGFAFLVNPAFIVRNVVGGTEQATRATDNPLEAFKHIKAQLDAVYGAFLKKDISVAEKIRRIEAVPIEQLESLAIDGIPATQLRREIEELGVLGSGYADIESFFDELEETGTWFDKALNKLPLGMGKWADNLVRMTENVMRSNHYFSLRSQGFAPDLAAYMVKKAFVDYSYASDLHRTIRDIFPFAQFSIGNLPVVAETMIERPRQYSIFRELMRPRGETILPEYIQGSPHIPLGENEQGQTQVMAQLGMPFEQLSFKNPVKSIGAALHPIPKYLAQKGFGTDFFFGGEYPSYRKAPAWARAIQGVSPTAADALLDYKTYETPWGTRHEINPEIRALVDSLNPLVRQSGMADKLMDLLIDRNRGVIDWTLNSLTGMRVLSVDQKQEARRIIAEHLKEQVRLGNVGEFRRFYMFDRGQTGPDVSPELVKKLQAQISLYNKK